MFFFNWVWLNIGWNWHHSCSGVYVWRCLHMSCAFRSCVKSGWNRVQRARALCTCKSRFHGSSDFPAEHLDLKSYEVVGFAGFNLKRVYLGRWFGPLQLRAKLSTAMYDFAGCTEPPTWSGITSFRKRDWRNSAAIPEASGSPFWVDLNWFHSEFSNSVISVSQPVAQSTSFSEIHVCIHV